MAFQSPGRSRASTDWVMVCSSTLIARAVIHSAKRGKPRLEGPREGAEEVFPDRPDESSVGHLSSPVRCLLGCKHLAESAQETTLSIRYICIACVEKFGETIYWVQREACLRCLASVTRCHQPSVVQLGRRE